jgi:hypothetical protein
MTVRKYIKKYGLSSVHNNVVGYRTEVHQVPASLKEHISKFATIRSNISNEESFLLQFLTSSELFDDEYIVSKYTLEKNKIIPYDFLQLAWRLGYQARERDDSIFIKKDEFN